MVEEFKKRNIPIQGLGMQMHIGISASNNEIESGMRQLAATGLLVHISEVSILVSDWKKDTSLVFLQKNCRKNNQTNISLLHRRTKDLFLLTNDTE